MFCTQCGTAFETQWRFCRQCGHELTQNVTPEAAQLEKAEAPQRARDAATSGESPSYTPSPVTAQNAQSLPANATATASASNDANANIVLARHLVGVGVLLLLNPAVWKSSVPLGVLGAWVGHYLPTVAIAGVLSGALTLFGLSTPWRTTFGTIAWIAAALSLVGSFIGLG